MDPIREQLNIDTPELVSIEMPLAGIGSRFIAILLDYLLCGVIIFVLGVIFIVIISSLTVFSGISANWALGIAAILIFVMQWGYFSLFEAFAGGRTPGKRVARIRVIHQSGRGISFLESLARNLVRAIDYLPSFYAIGVVAIFMTRRHQRLGDMVAGTLVVRDREVEPPQWTGAAARTITGAALTTDSPIPAPHLSVTLPAPALTKLSAADLEVLENFFSRRLDMDLITRADLAGRMASALCAKSGLDIPPGTSIETFLEAVAHQLREIGRMR